MVVIAEPETY